MPTPTVAAILFALFCLLPFSMAAASESVADADIKAALDALTEMPGDGTWPFDSGYARYDTLKRGPDKSIFGRWALTQAEACDGGSPYSSVPSEKSWKKGPNGDYCPDGSLVLWGVFAESARTDDAIDDIELFCGAGGGCDAFQRNQRARNLNDSRAIRATFQWRRSSDGSIVTRSYLLEPGAVITVTYCNCGAVTVTGARYDD